MSLEKVCVSVTCIYKSSCYLWRRTVESLHQQHISPADTGDSCHFYHERPRPWGEGSDPND